MFFKKKPRYDLIPIAEATKAIREAVHGSFNPTVMDRWVRDAIQTELKYGIEGIVRERLRETIDNKLVDKLSNEFVENFDFNTAVKQAMQEKIKDFIKRSY